MARQKRKNSAISFEALNIEGALLSPAMVQRIAARDAGNQTEADYRVPKGLNVRDEIARYFRIGQALFEGVKQASAAGTIRFTEELLREVFGFTDITKPGSHTQDGRDYVVTLEALGGRVPIVVVPPSNDLDRASDHLHSDGRRRSASSAIQDWLNANEDALWGFCCNGEKLRLVRDNASLTRPAYIEADLRQIFEAENYADFTALWLLIQATRFGREGTNVADCALERWRDAGTKAGLAARDRLRDGVEAALLALGTGFLSSNPDLRERVNKGELPLNEFFGQLLRLIYRLIFLAVAEDRNLLHAPNATASARKLYADGYAFGLLKERAIRRAAWDQHFDRWQGLLILFRALHGGEKLLGLPALGGLFQPELMPDVLKAKLPNRALMEAIYRLAYLKDDSMIISINWRDMETEELGSVYESLLELTPRLNDDGRTLSFAEGAETKGNARKTSGSYYTPDSLVQTLLDSALDPVLDEKERMADDPTASLLTTTVIDPACGSGHFLLAAARRIASRLARARAGGVANAEDYRHALRDVVRNCIYGVDRNPMAVELTKVALWIETVEPGKPLGFLDANIRCGDSLLGVFDLDVLRQGIPDEAYKPLTGDDKETTKYYSARNKAEKKGQGAFDFAGGGGKLPSPPPLAASAKALRALPEDSAEDIAEKKKRFSESEQDSGRWAWRTACDLYVAAFLVPKKGGAPANANTVTIPTTDHVWKALNGASQYGPLIAIGMDMAAEARAFHWPLEFSDVMGASGFDCVLGNPPWEVMQLSEEEYFTQRMPDVAELVGVARKNAIAELETAAPKIFAAYQFDKRIFEAGNEFARASGRFDLTAKGKVNTYSLFAEHFSNLAGKKGRAGVIVPTGIATDATTAPFFASLIDRKRLATLFDFENREKLFAAVDSRMKFCLLTIGNNVKEAGFAFFLTEPSQLNESERRFNLTPEAIARINPNTKTAPVFRSRKDAELTAKIYANFPVLINESKGKDGNPWNVEFRQGLFNMTSDSGLFLNAVQLREAGYSPVDTDWFNGEKTYVPLYEAKLIHQFDHRWATYDGVESRDATEAEKRDSAFEPTPRYWVWEEEVKSRLAAKKWTRQWLMGWRDITNATNERTSIFSMMPIAAVGHNCPLMFVDKMPKLVAALLGCIDSIPLDFIARQAVGGTHLTYGYLKQLTILPESIYGKRELDFILPRVLELTYTSHSMAPFARDLGYDGSPFAWDETRRALLRSELDAFYAKAYGLNRDELRYILDPADVMGADYPSETFRVLKEKEIKHHGEYRTQRLVLEAWVKMERGEFGPLFSTAPAIPIQTLPLFDLASLPDGAWTPQPVSAANTLAQLAAIIANLPGATPAAQVRLAGLFALEPRLLTSRLSGTDRSLWLRLCGQAAQPLPVGTTAFVQQVSASWGQAVTQLKGMSALIQDTNAQTWAAGTAIAEFGNDADDVPHAGRARFVLKALANMNLDQEIQSQPAEIRTWLAANAA